YDITVGIDSAAPIFPGDPPVVLSAVASQAQGDEVNLSQACFGLHTGSHVDAPYHVDASWPKLADFPLATFVGPARVVVSTATGEIPAAELARVSWQGVERVLFKTGNSALRGRPFCADYVSLSTEAADFLVEHTGVKLVGIDYLSIDKYADEGLPVHRRLLGRGILILEGLDLSAVLAGDYQLVCLPLRMAAGDGAPVRAALVG
ncbi:MAG: cyclase family protein, partial [Chloroflexota bacterium]